MRTEHDIRNMYRQYVYLHAFADIDGKVKAADQYYGAAFACGRTIGKDGTSIRKDLNRAKSFIKRRKAEGKPLPIV